MSDDRVARERAEIERFIESESKLEPADEPQRASDTLNEMQAKQRAAVLRWKQQAEAAEQERIEASDRERATVTHDEAWDAALAVEAERARQVQARTEWLAENARQQRAAQARQLAEELHSAIPARYRTASGSDYAEGPLRAAFPALLERVVEQRGVTLCGPIGSGKSHMVCALMREYANRTGRVPHFATFANVLEAVKRTYRDDGSRLEFDYWKCPTPLVLDDIGIERETEHSVSILRSIISERYDRCLPTWVVSNMDLAKGTEAMAREISRLHEMNGPPLVLKGRDRRRA